MYKVEISIPPKFSFDSSLIYEVAKKSLILGMFKVERTSKKDYLTGPRPEKLGVITGRLRNSIKTRVYDDPGRIRGEVGTNVFYGKFHEEGTVHHPKRSFLATAIKDEVKGIEKNLMDTLEDIIGGALS